MSNENIYLYENLNERTKKYIKKAIEIYLAIEEEKKEITYSFLGSELKADIAVKWFLSIIIAAFLVDSDLNNIIKQESNLKIDDLLSYAGISSDDIMGGFNESIYKNQFNMRFAMETKRYIERGTYEFKELTPELLFLRALQSPISKDMQKSILGEKVYYEQLGWENKIEDFAIKNDFIKIKIKFIPPSAILPPSVKKDRIKNFLDSYFTQPSDEYDYEEAKDIYNKTNLSDKNVPKENIWDMLEDIKKKFIGQETAVEDLFYNIVNNQELAKRDDVSDGERSIIFLDGPTGTGKTAITREITDKLDIPFTSSSVINYSSTGYVGGDITDTLKDLFEKSGGNLQKAQRGIIVFDEFDKIAYNQIGGLGMKQAVQQQLLDFMGGGKYKIKIGNNPIFVQEINFDTSKLTFICLGALTNLRRKKTEVKRTIGFGENSVQNIDTYKITPEDLMNIGLERELVGRFNTYLHTEEYSKKDLLKILKQSTISPMIGFKKWVESQGKYLEIEDEVYELIANVAYELNTGARSLQTIMNNIRTPFIKDVLRGSDKLILLNTETVNNVIENTISRKARK